MSADFQTIDDRWFTAVASRTGLKTYFRKSAVIAFEPVDAVMDKKRVYLTLENRDGMAVYGTPEDLFETVFKSTFMPSGVGQEPLLEP